MGGDLAYNALKRLPQVVQSRPNKVIVKVGDNDVATLSGLKSGTTAQVALCSLAVIGENPEIIPRASQEISKRVYRMIQSCPTEAAGRRIQSAAVVAYASAGEFARWNPHLHAIFLEGGFDREGQFVHVPSLDLAKLSQYFRSRMVAFFLKHSLLNERLARNMRGWIHSGFSVDLSVKIAATSSKARGPRTLHTLS